MLTSLIIRHRIPMIESRCLIYCGSTSPFQSQRWMCTPVPKKPELGLLAKGTQAYENYLQKNWPKAYKMHRTVIDGCKACVADIKTYYYIRRDLNSGKTSLIQLSRTQLETYVQTRHELAKIVAIVIIFPLPFALYILAIAMIFFPRYVLTRHFWTQEQRRKFWIDSLNKAATNHYKPLVQNLPKQGKELHFPLNIKELSDVKVKPLNELGFSELFHLSRIHRFLPINAVSNLQWRANALKHLDLVMQKDLGALDNMTTDELYAQMFIRCLNFEGLSDDEIRKILRQWIKKSTDVASNPSLFLQAPVFLQYNKKTTSSD